eukprot:TRINITY_DN10004_c0_g1_i1.p1 TRINITY_DN10004_c0_g1~~TRINITY_DN10004_c0_g1_i1.p1  ORF type:complete len:367 (+),score=62.60 TRINITY_DN10004_c0_g1_i1:25-1101(+)
MNNNKSIYIVTGASGCVGSVVVDQLLERDDTLIRILDLPATRNHALSLFQDSERVEFYGRDISNILPDDEIFHDVFCIIHCAAVIVTDPRKYDFAHRVNVVGTQNMIDGCIHNDIERLVNCSTLDVVVCDDPIVDGDETLPYPDRFLDPYSQTKCEAEIITKQANNTPTANGKTFKTCSIRLLGIFGERDNWHIPKMLQRANMLKFKLGDGSSRFHHLYVGNAAHGLILASDNLTEDSPVPGEIYFLGDDPSYKANWFDFFEPIFEHVGYSMPKRYIPAWVFYILVMVVEFIFKVLNLTFIGKYVPFPVEMSKNAYYGICVTHTFVSDKAERDFNYAPRYSKEEAFERTFAYLDETYQ